MSVNDDVPSKLETLMGRFIILSRDTPMVSRTTKGMMFIEDPVSKIARFNSMSLMQANICSGLLWWLDRLSASLLKKFRFVS